MGKRTVRKYTQEFKQQAAELANRMGITRAAEQLGVPVSSVDSWQKKIAKSGEQETKKSKESLEEENRRLKKENEELKKVNHILKRAAAFFSQDHLK